MIILSVTQVRTFTPFTPACSLLWAYKLLDSVFPFLFSSLVWDPEKFFSLKILTWPPVVSTLIVCNVPCLLVPTFMCGLLPCDWVLLCDQVWPIATWPDMANPGCCINQGWCNRRPDKHLHIGTCPVGTLLLGIQLAHHEATQAFIKKGQQEGTRRSHADAPEPTAGSNNNQPSQRAILNVPAWCKPPNVYSWKHVEQKSLPAEPNQL